MIEFSRCRNGTINMATTTTTISLINYSLPSIYSALYRVNEDAVIQRTASEKEVTDIFLSKCRYVYFKAVHSMHYLDDHIQLISQNKCESNTEHLFSATISVP